MMQFDRMTLGKKARELGFVRDTFEKVCRLADVLDLIANAYTVMKNNSILNSVNSIMLTPYAKTF